MECIRFQASVMMISFKKVASINLLKLIYKKNLQDYLNIEIVLKIFLTFLVTTARCE